MFSNRHAEINFAVTVVNVPMHPCIMFILIAALIEQHKSFFLCVYGGLLLIVADKINNDKFALRVMAFFCGCANPPLMNLTYSLTVFHTKIKKQTL